MSETATLKPAIHGTETTSESEWANVDTTKVKVVKSGSGDQDTCLTSVAMSEFAPQAEPVVSETSAISNVNGRI